MSERVVRPMVPLFRGDELTNRQVLAVDEVAGVLDTAALVEIRAPGDRRR